MALGRFPLTCNPIAITTTHDGQVPGSAVNNISVIAGLDYSRPHL